MQCRRNRFGDVINSFGVTVGVCFDRSKKIELIHNGIFINSDFEILAHRACIELAALARTFLCHASTIAFRISTVSPLLISDFAALANFLFVTTVAVY